MIVVDTNVLAYFLIEGDRTPAARTLWNQDSDWRLPSLWQHEFLNVLATYGNHKGAEATPLRDLWLRAKGLWEHKEVEVDLAAALRLALDHSISAYDAQFVVLAMALKVPLVTEDRRLRAAVHSVAVSVEEYLQLATE